MTERQPLITKYRPQKLEEIVGQEPTVAKIRGMLKKKEIPNAILLHGATGTGKTTLARIVARYVMCATYDNCGKCASCVRLIENHPDYREVNGAVNGGKEDILGLIMMSRSAPQIGNFRVICIDEAQKITPAAAESLLKPLEEPAPKTLWIIATSEPEALKPTIKNRCSKLDITPVGVEPLAKFLLGVCKAEKSRVAANTLLSICTQVAEASGGFIRESLSALDGVLSYIEGADLPKDPKALSELISKQVLNGSDAATVLLALKIVIAMSKGNVTGVANCMADVSEAIPLANKVLQFAQYALDARTNSNGRLVWHTPENKKMWDSMTKIHEGKPSIATLVTVMEYATSCRSELQKFAVAERYTMTSLYCQCAMRVKGVSAG